MGILWPPKFNGSAVLLQSTQILQPIAPSAADYRRKVLHLPHQGNKETRRRAKQLERARAKRG